MLCICGLLRRYISGLFVVSQQLREYPAKFGAHMAGLMSELKTNRPASPTPPSTIPPIDVMFSQMDWGSVWPEADVISAVRYIRGSKRLHIPADFKHVLPTEL